MATSAICVHAQVSGRSHAVVKALFALALAACGHVPPVAITDQCTPLSDPVLIAPWDAARWFAIGVVDHQTLLSLVWITDEDPLHREAVYAQWFDADFAATTARFSLGASVGAPNTRWVAFDGRLHGQVWTTASGDPYTTPVRLQIAIDALTPASSAVERTDIVLPITRVADSTPNRGVMEGPTGFGGDPGDRQMTAAVRHGRPVFALNAIPDDCGSSGLANLLRLMIFDRSTAFTDELGDPQCAGDVARASEFEAYDEVLVPFDGGLGLFYRNGISGGLTTGRLHYVRIGPDLHVLDDPPIDVDDQTVNFEGLFPSGYQTHAAQVEGGPILYLTRSDQNDWNVCSNLRLLDPNGANPRDAAWQMRCRISRDDALHHLAWAPQLSSVVRIEPLASGRAALVYNERTNFPQGAEYSTHLTTSTAWDEGVYLTTINALGQRTSEIIRVTPPQTTALDAATFPRSTSDGPFPRDIQIASASEGNEIVIAWLDLRADAPGYYARRYSCGPISP